jgi:hypothetical protein
MNDLVKRLSTGQHPVEAGRPEKNAKAFKECIDRDYVHIMFKNTETELGTQLNRSNCDFSGCDFESGTGSAHLEGGLILNYDKVKVVADIDLATMEGTGCLMPVGEAEYNSLMGRK